MEFVREYVFSNPNIEDIDEIIDKAGSDCSYKIVHSFKPLRLLYNLKFLVMKKIKTKNKVLKDISIAKMSFIWRMKQKDISIG